MFFDFDNEISRKNNGWDTKKIERIGKKYQWIALNEILARLSDNYNYSGYDDTDSITGYRGSWQLYLFQNIYGTKFYT